MPIKQSAKKALRQSEKNRLHNIWLKERYKKTGKEIRKLLENKKEKEAEKLLPTFYKYADKAAKTGIIKKNTAARKKANITKTVNKTLK